MADNYIERKMEEHRSKAVQVRKTPIASASRLRKGEAAMELAVERVFVYTNSNPLTEAIVRRFRSADCKVAFSSADSEFGRALAQSCGARFYPGMEPADVTANLQKVWGGADAVFTTDALWACAFRDSDLKFCAVLPRKSDQNPQEKAEWCVWRCLKATVANL